MRRPLGGFIMDPHDAVPDPQIEQRTSEQKAEAARTNFMLGQIIRRMEKIMHSLEEVLAVVTAQRDRISSLSALLAGMKKRLDDALGGALTPSQQMRVDAIFNQAEENKEALDAAITANTPEDPNPPAKQFATRLSISSSANPANVGDNVVLSGGVEKHPDTPADLVLTGVVAFFDGDTQIGSGTVDKDGVAVFSTTSLAAGEHAVHASYGGDANSAPSDSATLTQTIAVQPTPVDTVLQPQPVVDAAQPN
jgi:hypothetical protein